MILYSEKINTFSKISVLIVAFGLLAIVNITGIGLGKFGGSFEEALDSAMTQQVLREYAGSNYPDWLVIKGGLSGMLLLPIRMIAFVFAPLIPFMARTLSHSLGILDAFFYLLIFYNIFRNRFVHKKMESSRALIVMVVCFVIVFSFGGSNFGTNIRHRAKVLPVLLCIPLFNKRESKTLKIHLKE